MTALNISVNGDLLRALEKNPGMYCWGHIYKGTEPQLVAAGLVRPEWMPGRARNMKWRQRVLVFENGASPRLMRGRSRYAPGEGEAVIAIERTRGGSLYEVHKVLPESQQGPRWEALRVRRMLDDAASRASEPPDEQAWNPTAYLDDLTALVSAFEVMVIKPAKGEGAIASRDMPAHKLPDETVARLRARFEELKAIVASSRVLAINHAARPRPSLSLVKG